MSLGVKPAPPLKPAQEDEDDWETDPDFLNNVSEKEDVLKSDQIEKERKFALMPKPSDGYGGKFGVQHDRVDQCAVGFDYQGKVEGHASQRDYSHGFGGAFGVQTDRVDKSALGWDSRETLQKHESQKDYKMGFGGQFGIQSDRKDKSAAGWDEREQVAKHESQTDYKKGFGGQFGVQSDRRDKSALGWEEVEKVKPHESQTDYKKGFGGQFGVQSDRKDKSALGWDECEKLQSHESQTDYKKGFGGQFGVQSDRRDKSALGWEEHEKVEKHESQTDYKKGFGGQFGVQSGRQDKSALGWEEKQREVGGGRQAIEVPKPTEEAAQSQSKSDGVETCKGAAKSLRSKFEQMAMQGDQQNLDRARGERERRKREDEQLRLRQEAEERQRQQRLDEQWAKQSEDGVNEEGGQSVQQQQPRQRPSIGVRLPYATSAATSLEQQQQQRRSTADDHSTESETAAAAVEAEPHPPPVKVLPTVAESPQLKALTVPMGSVGGIIRAVQRISAVLEKAEEEEEEGRLGESAEWADETADPTQEVGEYGERQQQHVTSQHQYELPPIVADDVENDGITVAVAAAHSSEEADQNVPPSDPTPMAAAAASVEGTALPITSAAVGMTAIALFEYERQDDDEIGFEVNDLITDIEQIDVGWWRGVCKGRYGLFPANYVQLTERQ
uniref:SH3 domain-containing protein n=1 Tax=Globodera rostochiensis TaxID=31243 RepID=A0A914HLL5_GLORO